MLNSVAGAARALLVALPLALGLAAAAPAFETRSDGWTDVKVGALYLPADAGLFIAAEKGYFEAEKIRVEFSRVVSGADLISFVATNQVDVGSGGAAPGLFNAFNRGIGLQIVASKSIMLKPDFGSSILLVRKDLADSGEVKSVADLKGRKIAVNSLQSTSLNYIVRLLATVGLTRDDVDLTEMPIPQLMPALTNKAVDVILVFGATPGAIAKAGGVELPGSRVLDVTEDGDITNMMFYSPDFAASDVGKRFMVAFLKGQRDYYRGIIAGNGDKHEVCEIIRKYIPFMPEDCAGFPMPGADPNGTISVKSLETFQKEWIDWGVMREPADISAHINTTIVDAAVAELGAYKD